ncbi:MAG: acyl-CoA dehydrogenase [Neobacillus sp.]|nr:acyl-CoA dehydrogenase [Neobacillus sp.]
MLEETTEKIMKDFCTKELIHEAEQGKWPDKLWRVVEEAGLTTIAVNEDLGGTGGTFGDALSMLRVAGKYSAPIPLAETLLANWLLAELGLPISNHPLTIVHVGSQTEVPFTCIQENEGWSITGQVKNIPFARFAKSIVFIGTLPKGFLVAMVDSADCIITPGSNLAGEPRDTINLEQVFVSKEDATIIKLESILSTLYQKGALIRSVMMAGALERILELSILYSNERKQFGRPINRFQAIQQQLAIMSGEVAAAKIITEYAVEAFDDDSYTSESMIAKIRVGEAATIAVPIAHQIHGAIGFTDEHILQQSTRRLWSWRDEYGTETDWSNELGSRVIENGHSSLWSFIVSEKQYSTK